MQRTGAVKLGDILTQYIEESGLKDDFLALDIRDAWKDAVGPRVAAATASVRFKDGILYCCIKSSIVRNRLYYNLDGIVSSINGRLGSDYIKKVVLR